MEENTMEEATVTDISFLKHFTSGDNRSMAYLISVFFTTSTDALDKMENEIVRQDWERVSAIAHSFKPQLSYMGIKSAEPLINEIENSKNTTNAQDNVPQLFNSLKSVVNTATDELKRVTERLS